MVNYDMKILIADDFATMRMVITKVLKELGFCNLAEATNGREAMEMLENDDRFKLLLLDWVMPEASGLDVIKFIHGHSRLKDMPIIMITAEAERDQIIEAAQAGVDDYMVKPFKPLMIKEKIEQVFRDPKDSARQSAHTTE